MRSAFLFSLVISVASVFSQRPFVRYSENLRRVVPPHFKHDQKNPGQGVDKVARRHQIGPRQPPLSPHQAVPWLRWVHEGRLAAQADRNSELHKVRAKLLADKLKPNQFIFKPHINPQLKPKLNRKGNARVKRETGIYKVEKAQEEIELKENVRLKRDLPSPQMGPEVVMLPQAHVKEATKNDQFTSRIKDLEKREKRQILYFINRPPQFLARSPRTTPNPFIRDTHIEEYDIIRPEVGEREGMIPTVESGSSDPSSYPLVSETSDLEYESDYTISMSDSEDWHNYPLTTPSGPNPGWQLSTLADIYQKQRRVQTQYLTPEKTRHTNTNFRVWKGDDQNVVRAKRSPKERKRKIGAYKEKIKQRRKMKDMRRKRRIIRNSKEDKAVKEDLKDEKAIERLLERPRVFPRQTAYQTDETSREILWTNGTHNIVEDKDATVKWINETHYLIYKDKDNSTDEWYHQHHVLCYNEEWENMTSAEKRNATIGAQDEEEEEEEVKVKAAEKTKPGGKAVKKKGEKRRKGKRVSDKKAVKPKKKSKKSKKIMTVKNVNEAPKDPRRDPREKKVKEKSVSSEESEKEKIKKQDKVKTDEENDSSTSKERKKKKRKIKTESVKEEDVSGKKKKKKRPKSDSLEGIDKSTEKKRKRKKDKPVKESQKEDSSEKSQMDKEKKKDKKKKKKTDKSDESRDVDVKKRKKKTRSKDEGSKKGDKEETRKKRSIYRSDESKTAEVRWEKVAKSEYDGWTVFGGHEDKSEVYDASYELVETRNITKKP